MWKQILLLCLVLVPLINSEIIDLSEFSHFRDVNLQPHMQKVLNEKYLQLTETADEQSGKVPFIVGGNFATRGQIPHQATLLAVQGSSGWLCGGTFVNETWVLTAAHCVVGKFQYITIMGGHVELGTPNYVYREIVSDKNNIYIHKSFNEDTLNNDIAMIKLPRAIPKGNAYIGQIELPKGFANEKFVGYNGTVSGFGRFSDLSNSTSSYLKYVTLPIITNAECAAEYVKGAVLDTNICGASTRDSSSCSGDSGGPFTVTISNKTVIVGIVSFGSNQGCQKGHPSGFTRVTSYLGWIDAVMNASPQTIVINIMFIITTQIALMIWNL